MVCAIINYVIYHNSIYYPIKILVTKVSLKLSCFAIFFLHGVTATKLTRPKPQPRFQKPKLTLYVNNKAKYQALNEQVRINRGTGGPDPPPPGKAQVI